MARARTIGAITGSRADFGLLEPVLQAIRKRGDSLMLRLIATGTHLTTTTWRDIVTAGLAIDAKAPMQKNGETGRAADAVALGRGIQSITHALHAIRPRVDIVLVLGDRIEAMAGALAASVGGFYLAHIHGGDRAEGVADEGMRHAISKLAHIHFAATIQSRDRLIKMGEREDSVHMTGSPAMDGLRGIDPVADGPEVIVVQHPVGGTLAQEREWIRGTLKATERFHRIALAPNNDPGSAGIRVELEQSGLSVTDHMPRREFLSLLAGAKVIVGNSSAGLIEAAALKVPCVNVGPRQAGREKPANVIDCPYGETAVAEAIDRALQLDLSKMTHPYGDGHAGQRIADLLAAVDLASLPLRKHNTY